MWSWSAAPTALASDPSARLRLAAGWPMSWLASLAPLAVACLLVLGTVAPALAQAPPIDRQATTEAQESDPEAAPTSAPVMLGGEPVAWIATGVGPYTPQARAGRIARRLEEIVHDRSVLNPTVRVIENERYLELRVGQHLLMVVTEADERSVGAARSLIAQHYAGEFEAAIRAERLRYEPGTLLRAGGVGAAATVAFLLAVWLIRRTTRALHDAITSLRQKRFQSLELKGLEFVTAHRLGLAIGRLFTVLRFVLILLAFDLYLTFVLGLFPWTRAVSSTLFESLLSPLRAAGMAFVGYLPNLFFVVVIASLVYGMIRAVGFLFHHVAVGRITFPSFPAEWAVPTNKIARVLLIAFGVVVAFPYLPASNSPAFAGVSVFMGILISLASSSSLSNMIAGLVLTYTGAFRLGERVKIGEAYGDIAETTLLATRIRTIKNEEITIPNTIVIGSAVINYSRQAASRGLILHTSITIGYDTPWRTVHDLMIGAALDTPGILASPAPFVWQTSLNDFHVTYEINAYTDRPHEVPEIYASLHARLQDAFCNAGVEIMSPHYTSLRDGNSPTTPPPVAEAVHLGQPQDVS